MANSNVKMKVSVSIDPTVVKKSRKLAKQDSRSFSSYVEVLLRRHIESAEANK